MFAAHADAYGSLDVAILNAGILERGATTRTVTMQPLDPPSSHFTDSGFAGHLLDDDISQYDHYMGIAMMGVIYGTQLASQTMSRLGSKGESAPSSFPAWCAGVLQALGLARGIIAILHCWLPQTPVCSAPTC